MYGCSAGACKHLHSLLEALQLCPWLCLPACLLSLPFGSYTLAMPSHPGLPALHVDICVDNIVICAEVLFSPNTNWDCSAVAGLHAAKGQCSEAPAAGWVGVAGSLDVKRCT